jgi:hypothetical protein
MTSTDKRQFLDPLGGLCKVILLKLLEPNTKIRIIDHTIQMVPDNLAEKVYRHYYGDSREDLHVLYPTIVRFIELYLIPKRGHVMPNFSANNVIVQQKNQEKKSITKVKKVKAKRKPKAKQQNDIDLFGGDDEDIGFGFSGTFDAQEEYGDDLENDTSDEEIEEQIEEHTKPNELIDLTFVQVSHQGLPHTQSFENDTSVYDALVSIAKNIIDGFKELQKTYKYGTVVLTLQLYINLLEAGLNGTYTRTLLPEHLRDLTSRNLLSDEKIRTLWKDDEIIEFGKLLKFCFESSDSKKEISSMSSYRRAAINSMLEERDRIFKDMISSTNCG